MNIFLFFLCNENNNICMCMHITHKQIQKYMYSWSSFMQAQNMTSIWSQPLLGVHVWHVLYHTRLHQSSVFQFCDLPQAQSDKSGHSASSNRSLHGLMESVLQVPEMADPVQPCSLHPPYISQMLHHNTVHLVYTILYYILFN